MNNLSIGEIVQTKKAHPCGNDKWEIVRNGADIKAKCLGCEHIIMMPRSKFMKTIKKRNLKCS